MAPPHTVPAVASLSAMELSEHARANRDAWNEKAVDDVELAERQWGTDQVSWGIWNVPETQVNVLPDVDGKDVVELGCGTAYVSAWLARRGARPVGIDVSENQLATARRMQAEHGLDFPLHHASAEAVPLPGDSADLVISEYGASLWCDPDAWLAEAARLLRPGGDLVFLTNSLLVTLCAPDEGPATDRLLRDQRGLKVVTYPDEDGVEFHIPPRRVDRGPRPARLHGPCASRAVRARRRAADEVRVGDARVGAALARRGDLGGDVEVLTAHDAGEVLTLQRAAYVGEAMLYDQFLPPLFETLDEVRAVLGASDVTVLGIRDDGRLIGTVRIKTDGEIARLAVAPDRQHEGLGTRLLRAAIERGGSWLFTGDRSEANLRLYRRHGFQETHREPVPGHELIYLKRLEG